MEFSSLLKKTRQQGFVSQKSTTRPLVISALKKLAYWHIVAAVVHGLSFVAVLVVTLIGEAELKPALMSDRVSFSDNITSGYFLDEAGRQSCSISAEEPASGAVIHTELSASYYDLSLVLLPMPAATAIFHIIQAYLSNKSLPVGVPSESSYVGLLLQGINWVRWLEYSITATLMTWILCQLSGITNVFLVSMIAVTGNISLQWHGYLHEAMMFGPQVRQQAGYPKGQLVPWKTLSNWVPMLNGFVIFIGQWSVLACYFARTAQGEEGNSEDSGAPWFVWVSFFGMLVTFLTFPAVQIIFTLKTSGRCGKGCARCLGLTDWYSYEWAFILLSLISKLLLDWTLVAAILSERS